MTSTTPTERIEAHPQERPIEWPEVLFIAAFIPLAVFFWVGILLAGFGVFTGWRIAAAGGVLSAIALAAAWRDVRGAGHIQRVSGATLLSVELLAALSATLLSRPGEYLIEGADASVYLAVGHNIGRTGGIIATDPAVSLMPQDLCLSAVAQSATSVRIGIDASCWANRRGYGRYTRELVAAILDADTANEYTLFLDSVTERQCPDLPAVASRVIISTRAAAADAASAAGHRSLGDLWAMARGSHAAAAISTSSISRPCTRVSPCPPA